MCVLSCCRRRRTDPFHPHWLDDALVVRDHLKKKLGTDLKVDADHNPFWHTGNKVIMNNGNIHTRRPWLWIWQTALGLTAGAGRSTREPWWAYFQRFVREHMFAY